MCQWILHWVKWKTDATPALWHGYKVMEKRVASNEQNNISRDHVLSEVGGKVAVRFFAWEHKLSVEETLNLIQAHGKNYETLDRVAVNLRAARPAFDPERRI
jgi:hypothetical protein